MNRDNQGRFARARFALKNLAKKAVYLSMFALIAIVAWERIDDRVESKWHDLTVTEYVAATTSPIKITSDEEKLIDKYRNSNEAQTLVDAWAKGKAAEDMRIRAEELAEDARADSMGFTLTAGQ